VAPASEAATPVAEVAPTVDVPAPAEVAPTGPPAPAPRRVIMPQTGPRPIYTAPAPFPGAPARNRPIFERPRPGRAAAPDPSASPELRPRRPRHGTRRTPPHAPHPHLPRHPAGRSTRPPRLHSRRSAWSSWLPGARPGFGARPGGAPGGAPGAMPGPRAACVLPHVPASAVADSATRRPKKAR
jgi:translation initiation factor IF-2